MRMKNLTLVFILTAVFIAAGALAYLLISKNGGLRQQTVGNSSNNTNSVYSSNQSPSFESSVLDDLGEPHLSGTQARELEQQLRNWSLYFSDSSVQLGGTDCGHSSRADQLVASNRSDKRSYNLNGGLKITTTPNLYHWTRADLSAFVNDQTVVCDVATTVPHAIIDGYIVWWNTCVGGAGPPNKNSPLYEQTVRCLQAEEVANRYFGIVE